MHFHEKINALEFRTLGNFKGQIFAISSFFSWKFLQAFVPRNISSSTNDHNNHNNETAQSETPKSGPISRTSSSKKRAHIPVRKKPWDLSLRADTDTCRTQTSESYLFSAQTMLFPLPWVKEEVNWELGFALFNGKIRMGLGFWEWKSKLGF